MCTLEYGTFDRESGQRAFRADHWLHKYGDPLGRRRGRSGRRCAGSSIPTPTTGRKAVLFRGHQVVRQAIAGSSAARSRICRSAGLRPAHDSERAKARAPARGTSRKSCYKSPHAVLLALVAFAVVTALNLLVVVVAEPAGRDRRLDQGAVAGVSFAPYRPGQSPLTRTFPTPDQIEQDLKRLQGKVLAVRTYSAGENLETVPQRAGKYGLKVWHGAWLNDNDKENLEQINLLIDHANRYPGHGRAGDRRQRGAAAQGSHANQLRGYIRQVKSG
jgi:hypothetical protein